MTRRTIGPLGTRIHRLRNTAPAPSTTGVLGSVWTTGQTDLSTQLTERGYHSGTRVDANLMPPAIAAHAITTLTHPGDLVLDPDCGAGTTLVEALHAGRHTIGLTGTRRSWRLARANVSAAKAAGAPVDGMVLVLDRRPTTLATAHLAGFTGRIDLILTTLRPTVPHPGPRAVADAVERLHALLAESRTLVRPQGHVVVTIPAYRDPDRPTELLDVPSDVQAAATAAGLVPLARCLALTAALHRDGTVRAWATRAQRQTAAHIERLAGHPVTLPGHHTVLVFGIVPPARDAALAMPIPPLPDRPRRRHYRSRSAAA
jgi:modification methylase